jgi:hypothetical protein
VALRESWKTFAAVARSVGFKRTLDAQATFMRALLQRTGEERTNLVQRESVRRDQLETRIRTRDVAGLGDDAAQAVAVEKMSEMLA